MFSFFFLYQSERRAVSRSKMLALNSSGRAVFCATTAGKTPLAAAPMQRRRRSSSSAIVSATAEPQDFNYASPKPYSSPQAGEDLTPYFGKVHAHDAKPANTIHAW